MKKRSFIYILLVLTLVFSLASCGIGGGDGDNTQGDQPPADNGSTEIKPCVIQGKNISDADAGAFVSRLAYAIYNYIEIKPADTAEAKGQIIFGNTDGSVSEKAQLALSRLDKEENEVGYVIYVRDGAVAISFDSDDFDVDAAMNTVVDRFVAEFINAEGEIAFDTNKVVSGVVNFVDYQQALDDAMIEKKWATVKTKLTTALGDDTEKVEEIYAALKSLYTNYNDGVISWFANLYEPSIGGYYYSNSARNTQGFFPDIESTSQALDFISGSGLTSKVGSVKNALPEWMQRQLIYFFKSKQDPNGYFYHPQWSKEAIDANDTRRGRDLSKAVSGLAYFGVKPTYDTPQGDKGDGILADGTPVGADSASLLTPSLRVDKVLAVSKVVAVASEGYVHPYLQSKESFKAYLNTLDINGSPYKTSSVLSTWTSQIVARDKQLKAEGKEGLEKTYFEWLESKQNPKTGLWTTYDYADYEGVNGLLKISGVWSVFKRPFPHAMEAANSTLEVISAMKPEDVSAITDIYNTWYAVLNIIQNVQSYNKELDTQMAAFRSELLSNAAPAINNTKICIAAFAKPDGSFSYSKKYTSPTSSGMYVALPKQEEGDINATELASVGTVGRLFDVLGLGAMVPLYTEADRIRYVQILNELDEAIKDEAPVADPYTYDDDIVDNAPGTHTVTFTSDGAVSVQPDKRGEGNVLQIKTNAGYDYVIVPSASMIQGASRFVTDTEFCITEANVGFTSQIQLYSDCHMITVSVKDENEDGKIDGNDGVWATEDSSTTAANSVSLSLGRVASVGEWFKLRVEYYVLDEASKEIRAKLFVNGELVAVTDNYYNSTGAKLDGNGKPSTNFTGMRVILTSASIGTMLLDNALITKDNVIYKEETREDLILNVDAADKPEKVYDFEDGMSEDISAEEVTVSDGKLLLGGGSIKVPVTVRTKGSNCNIAEMKLKASENIDVGATYELVIGAANSSATAMMRVRLVVKSDSEGKYLALADASNGVTGVEVDGFRAPVGKEFTLGIQYFKTIATSLIYIDGSIVSTFDTFCTMAKNRTYGYLVLTDVSDAGKNSEITVDDVKAERNVVSYEAATKPEIGEKKYEFDSMPEDAVTSGGVKVEDGSLVLSDNGSVRLPVNKRSPVISATLLEMLINTVDKNSAFSFVLSLVDDNGGAVFALEFANAGGEISVFEVTENKTYGTPLATFGASGATLKLLYSRAKDMVNLYVNGVCVAVTSVTYSENSDALSCDSVELKMKSGSGLALDSLVAESYNMLFTAEKNVGNFTSENPISFERDTTGSVAKHFTLDFRSAAAALRVKEMMTRNGASKVVKYTTSNGANDSLYIPITSGAQAANAVYFEADMMLDMDDKNDGFEIYLMAGSKYAARVTLAYSSGYVALNDSIGGKAMASGKPAKVGEWFKLRIEYSKTEIDYNFDGAADVLIKIYINDTLLGTSYNAYDPYYAYGSVTQTRIYSYNAADCSIYLDNVAMAQFNMLHDPKPEPPEEEEPAPTPDKPSYKGEYYGEHGGLDFEGGPAYSNATPGYLFGTYKNTNSSPTGYTLYDKAAPYEHNSDRLHLNVVADPADAANKVLWMHRHNSTDRVDLVFTNKKTGLSSGNHFVFETDLMIVDTSGVDSVVTAAEAQDYIIHFNLSKTSGDGTSAWWSASDGPVLACIYAKRVEDGYKYYLSAQEQVDTSENGGLIEIYKWSTITLDASDNGVVDMYVDGKLVLSKTFKSGGVDLDATYDSILVNLRWGMSDGAGFYFDNTFVGFVQVGEEATEPENPGTGEGGGTDEPTKPDTPTEPENPEDSYDGEYFTEYGGLVYNDAESARSLAVDGLVYGCNRNNIGKHSLAGYMIYDSSTTATTNDRAYLNITADPTDAANKVLMYHKYDSKDTTPLVFTTNKSGMKTGNCFVFETKIMIKSAETAALASYATQTYNEALAIELGKSYTSTNSSGQTVYSTGSGTSDTSTRGLVTACISIVADASAEGGYRYCVSPYQFVNTLDMGGEIKTDEWHTLRVEVYDDGVAKYYVDGTHITSKTVKSGGVDIDATYDSVMVRLRGGLNNGFGVYFDDTFVGIVTKE